MLWNGGISFGGVLAFISADLIVLPIFNIYRKYYGLKMAGVPARHVLCRDGGSLPFVVDGLFGDRLGLIPREHQARVVEATDHVELHDLAQHRDFFFLAARHDVAVRHDGRHRLCCG